MTDFMFLGSVAILYSMLVVSPGPNFLVVTTAAMSQSRRQAIYVGLGVTTGSVIWASLATAGLGVLLAHMAWLQRSLQIGGGTYLLYIGANQWRNSAKPLAAAPTNLSRQSACQAYRYGLVTNLTNPGSLAFFSSVFAALFAPSVAPWLKFASIAIVAVISTTWQLTVAMAFSLVHARQAYVRAKTVIDRCTGGFLALFGMKLVLRGVRSPVSLTVSMSLS
jgi:threonine efflux protein